MSYTRPFCPKRGGTTTIANAVTASAAAALDAGCSEVMLFNSSTTAISFVRIDVVPANSDTGGLATVAADLPVPPNGVVIVSPGVGFKFISVIASAANGSLYATPGHGGV